MTIRDFADVHGLKAIVRRHAVYNKPTLPVDGNMMCALIYSRTIDPDLLGLNTEGTRMMYHQGVLLAEMGIMLQFIVSGMDRRNIDGAETTAAAINEVSGISIPTYYLPSVTYPYYNATKAYEAWQKFGDMAAHMYLAERPEVEGLWKESAAEFEARITSAISTCGEQTTLFDLNFEQVTLLHFLHVEKIRPQDIPFDKDAWCPKNGGGIAYGADGVVMEFDPEFNMIIKVIE